MKTVPNQRVVTNKKKKPTKMFLQVEIDSLELAMRELTHNELKMYLYMMKHAPDYTYALSNSDAQNKTGISSRGYRDAVNSLIKKGYLVETSSNHFESYDIPPVRQTLPQETSVRQTLPHPLGKTSPSVRQTLPFREANFALETYNRDINKQTGAVVVYLKEKGYKYNSEKVARQIEEYKQAGMTEEYMVKVLDYFYEIEKNAYGAAAAQGIGIISAVKDRADNYYSKREAISERLIAATEPTEERTVKLQPNSKTRGRTYKL